MIDEICDYITKKIKEKVENIDEEKEMVINFGVKIIFGEIPKIILIFIIGFLLNIGRYTIILFILLAPYRSFTGGFHLKTHIGCMFFTSVLYIIPIMLAKYIPISNNIIFYILLICMIAFSIFIILKYAPADTENIPILSNKERKNKKIKASCFLIFLIVIICISSSKIIKYILIYGIILQNLTVIPISYKIVKCKYSDEIYNNKLSNS